LFFDTSTTRLSPGDRKQLNKVEGSQKFSKAISFGHNHEFIQSEKEDQEIAEAVAA